MKAKDMDMAAGRFSVGENREGEITKVRKPDHRRQAALLPTASTARKHQLVAHVIFL